MTKTGPSPTTDEEIELSCTAATLRLDRVTVQAVVEDAERLGISIYAQALTLWFLGGTAAARYPGPTENVLRFSEWILSGRGAREHVRTSRENEPVDDWRTHETSALPKANQEDDRRCGP